MFDYKKLIETKLFQSGIVLGINSIHGLSHWRKVEENGLYLAIQNGADKLVISLFAYLHDARRENEGEDEEHGSRAAILLNELISVGIVNISEMQYKQLTQALIWHNSDLAKSNDVTVQTCWDADRLDLGRVGIKPDPKRLFTEEGKKMAKYHLE